MAITIAGLQMLSCHFGPQMYAVEWGFEWHWIGTLKKVGKVRELITSFRDFETPLWMTADEHVRVLN